MIWNAAKKTKITKSPVIVPEWPTTLPPIVDEPEPVRKKTELPPPGETLRASGVLMLTKEFNQDNIMPLVMQILEYNMMDPAHAPETIKLYINSPGGAVASAWHLIDTMKQSRIPVHTIAMGMAASCGCLTLMAGEPGHRYVTQNTSVMSHVYSAGSGGKEHDLYARVRSFEQTSKAMVDHYVKCTGKDAKYVRTHLLPAEDVWLTPEEAVKHGVVDHIIKTY